MWEQAKKNQKDYLEETMMQVRAYVYDDSDNRTESLSISLFLYFSILVVSYFICSGALDC